MSEEINAEAQEQENVEEPENSNINFVEESQDHKLDEMIRHYTNESYLQDILADYKEGYDFEFDEDELKREAGKIILLIQK